VKITKFTHACVRLEHDGRVLVIDPGVWTEAEVLPGADAVLITHEHNDHVDAPRLAGLGVPVVAPAAARIEGLTFDPITTGSGVTLAGFTVEAVGDRHALIHGGKPDLVNLGYVIAGRVYIPGDALHVPDQRIETLFVPAHGSWLKTTEAIAFATAIKPDRAFAIHDAGLSERGLEGLNGWFGREIGPAYRWLAPGETA
jgi:L-ascorbate metabolism protein UlaG (beta-lactamase superfamily)